MTVAKKAAAQLARPSHQWMPANVTRAMASALELNGYYRLDDPDVSASEAEFLISRGDVTFVVTVPSDFGRRVEPGDRHQFLIEADAADTDVASGAISTLGTVAADSLLRETRAEAAAARAQESQLSVIVDRRYNPEGMTQCNIVPGVLGVILQMTMVMMTSIALSREIERGTMENLLSMPVIPVKIMLGKVPPCFFVSAIQVSVVRTETRLVFHVSFVGSLALLLGGVLVFVMVLVILGYLIPTVARTQMQAMQVAFFYILASLLRSGFMFPYRGMAG
jgi:ABC-2 type transport system permease protein